MSQDAVLELVEHLNHGLQSSTRAPQEFEEVVELLARSGIWVEAEIVPLAAGTSVYALPTNLLVLLQAFYDDRQLDLARISDFASVSAWREHQGTPLAYVQEDETDRTFRIYPKPILASHGFIPLYGAPLGLDYPEGSVVVLATARRTTLQPWLYMYVALQVSALEFTREGAQRDEAYAKACMTVASVVADLLA